MKKINESLQLNDQWQAHYQKTLQSIKENPDIQSFMAEHSDELSDHVIERSFNQLLEFVRENESYQQTGSAAQMPGFRPRLMMDGTYISVTYVPTEKQAEKNRQQQIKKRITYVDIPKAVRNASFDQLAEGRTQAVDALFDFIEVFLKKPSTFHKGIYLWGNFGRGKTYLMGALVNKLAERGYSSTFINLPTFISELKDSFNVKENAKNTTQRIAEVKKAPLLVLDDIGAEAMSDWVRDEVIGVILQYRMQEELPTFFTSNLDMNQYEHYLTETKQSTDSLKAQRIMERIRYLADEISVRGPNLRH